MQINAMRFANQVVVAGVPRTVDLSTLLPDTISAVTWPTASTTATVEYARPQRNAVEELPALRQAILNAWTAAAPAAPTPPPADTKSLDRGKALDYLVDKLISAEAASPTAPDYVKRAAAEAARKVV
ncbi:MAG: hypothetical protein AB7P99_14255 [Vicinamibacterales bacterium]